MEKVRAAGDVQLDDFLDSIADVRQFFMRRKPHHLPAEQYLTELVDSRLHDDVITRIPGGHARVKNAQRHIVHD